MSGSGRNSIVGASVWMLVISLLLFWLPFVGPLLGGVIGGRKAGGVVRAFIAALVPAFIVGALLFVLATLYGPAPDWRHRRGRRGRAGRGAGGTDGPRRDPGRPDGVIGRRRPEASAHLPVAPGEREPGPEERRARPGTTGSTKTSLARCRRAPCRRRSAVPADPRADACAPRAPAASRGARPFMPPSSTRGATPRSSQQLPPRWWRARPCGIRRRRPPASGISSSRAVELVQRDQHARPRCARPRTPAALRTSSTNGRGLLARAAREASRGAIVARLDLAEVVPEDRGHVGRRQCPCRARLRHEAPPGRCSTQERDSRPSPRRSWSPGDRRSRDRGAPPCRPDSASKTRKRVEERRSAPSHEVGTPGASGEESVAREQVAVNEDGERVGRVARGVQMTVTRFRDPTSRGRRRP